MGVNVYFRNLKSVLFISKHFDNISVFPNKLFPLLIGIQLNIIFNIIKNFHLLENFVGKSKTQKNVENIVVINKRGDTVPLIPVRL